MTLPSFSLNEAAATRMPGVTPAQVASFYEAAAFFFQKAPWKRVGYEAAIRHVGGEDPQWPAVFLDVSRMLAVPTDLDKLLVRIAEIGERAGARRARRAARRMMQLVRPRSANRVSSPKRLFWRRFGLRQQGLGLGRSRIGHRSLAVDFVQAELAHDFERTRPVGRTDVFPPAVDQAAAAHDRAGRPSVHRRAMRA